MHGAPSDLSVQRPLTSSTREIQTQDQHSLFTFFITYINENNKYTGMLSAVINIPAPSLIQGVRKVTINTTSQVEMAISYVILFLL